MFPFGISKVPIRQLSSTALFDSVSIVSRGSLLNNDALRWQDSVATIIPRLLKIDRYGPDPLSDKVTPNHVLGSLF